MSNNKGQKKIQKITKLKYAVLICERFNSDIDSQNCLSKVDNWPTIWYTLNWLGENSIEEIFVIYSKDKEPI
jgi:choline kinase